MWLAATRTARHSHWFPTGGLHPTPRPHPAPTTHLPLPLRLQLKGVQTELTEVRDAATSTAAKLTATVETMTTK
jgi:hypothetical protein